MKYFFLVPLAAVLFSPLSADAARPETRQEAIELAKRYEQKSREYREKLEQMTDTEWLEMKKLKETEKQRKKEKRKDRQAKREAAEKNPPKEKVERPPVKPPIPVTTQP